MVGIGVVGLGFMGMIHDLAARKLGGARVVALCSRDPNKLAGDWTGIQGNFGPRGRVMDLSAHARYADVDGLFADPSVDLVDLCVPNDEHARLAVKALEAGKHVLVEKPIALSLADADRMLDAARGAGRLLMVAHVLPFFPEFAFAADAVRSGKYGALQAAHLYRVISRPDWSSGINDPARSGGPAVDLHVHDTHFVGLVCGAPRAVRSIGRVEDGAVVHLTTQYQFADAGPAVSSLSGALSQAGRPFTHGFEFYLERATITYSSANFAGRSQTLPLSVILPDGTTEVPSLGSGDPIDAFAAELAAAARSVETGQAHPILSGDLARSALATCLAEAESVRTGQTVHV